MCTLNYGFVAAACLIICYLTLCDFTSAYRVYYSPFIDFIYQFGNRKG